MLRLISNINSSFLKGMIAAAISFILSFDVVGQSISWQWGKTEASSFSESGKKIVVDELGNSYSVGTFTGTITVGASTYTSIGGSDILLVKYNAAGVRIWSKQYGSNLNDDVNSLQYDKAGYLYLNGTFYGASFQYGSGSIPNTTSGNLEVYLLRIDASGNVKWGFHPQGNGQDYAGNVYSDGASVIITGNFQSPSIQFGAISMVNASFRSMFLARLDSTGVVLWAKQFGNGYIDAGNGVSMDNSGAIFVTGNLGSPSLTLGATTLTRLGAGGTFDIFIAKFDGSGNPIWAKSAAGTGTEEPIDLVTDEKGNSYITGYFKSTSINFSGTVISNPSALEQFFIARYDSSGSLKWVRKSITDVQSRGLDISLATENKIFAVGYYSGGAINFNTALTNSGSNDGFIVQYDSLGNVSWSDKAGGTGDDKAAGVSGTSCGGVITGEFNSPTLQLGTISVPNVSSGTFDFFTSRFGTTFSYNLPVDTLRVCGTTALLDAGAGYASYAWNTFAQTQQITADVSGRYVVTVFNQDGCVASDSVYVSIVTTNILQNDTIICKGNPVHLAIDSAWMKGKLFHSFTKNMNSTWNVAVTTIPDARYRMVVSGTWAPSIWPTERLDAANVFKTADNSFVRKWQSPTDLPASFTLNGTYIRPQTDVYRTDHIYDYYFSTPVGTQFNIGFNEVVVSDNSGALSFDLYAINNPVTVHWSTGATTNSIDVAPTSTTTYYVTITDGISSCTDSVKITILDAPTLILPDTLKVCGDSIELDAGAGASSYIWSTGATTQKIIASANGKYKVTAGNALGCSRTDSVYVSLVKAVILQNDTSVCKASPLTLTAQTGAGLTYLWSNNVTGSTTTVSPLISSKYFLTVSDGIGQCTDSIQVNVLDLPQAALPDTIKVCGSNTLLDAGAGFSSYLWSNGAVTQSISASASGKYFVTVMNATGCSSMDSVYVSLISSGIQQNDTSVCKGSSLLLSAITGSGYSYSWSNGELIPSISINPMVSAKYYLSVSDGIGSCSDSVMVSVLALPQAQLPDSIKICGSSAILDAGAGFNTYNWNNGATTQTTSVTASGKYFVTVTNATGCSSIDSVYVSLINSGIQQNDTSICKGSSLLLSAITGTGYNYFWSNGAITTSININPTVSSKYYLSVSDGIGSCTDSILVSILALPQPTLQDSIKICGTSALLDAGSGFASYNWNNGATSQTISITASGKYYVTVTNASGCTAIDSVYVSLVRADILQGDTSICKGSSLALQAFSNPSYTYLWSTGSTGTSIVVTPLANTKFYLQVSNGVESCKDSVIVTINNLPQAALADTIKICGTQVQLDAGVGFSTYSWSNGSTSRIITASQRGSYKVIVTDGNGCSNSDSSFVSLVNANILQNDTSICKGSAIILQAYSDPAYTYNWSVGQIGSSISVAPGATTKYYLNTSDGYQTCSDSIQISILTIDTSISVAGSTTTCAGGSVQLTAVAGYTYQWYRNGMLMPGAVNRILQATQTGSYRIHIYNSNGCSDSSNAYSVNIASLPVVSLNTLGPVTVCEGSTIALSAIVTANAPGVVQYQWLLNGVAVSGATLSTYNTNLPGNYSVNVTNSNGCSATSLPVTVVVSTKPVISLQPSASAAFCIGGSTVLRSAVNAGNSSVSSYQWYKNAVLISGAIADTLSVNAAGQYNLVVTNSNGCTSISSSVTVTESALPVGSIIPPAVTKICRGVYAILQATGGTRYNWYLNGNIITGSNSSILNATEAGVYSVEIFNAAGCSSMGSNTVSLSVIEVPKPDFSVITKCAGTATTFTNKTTSDPTDVVNYTWNTGDGSSYVTADAQHIFSKGGQYTISLSATSTACPFQPIVKTIPIVIEQSRAGIAYAPINAIEGRPTQLQARNFGVQYQWSPATGLNNRTIAAPVATNTTAQTYLVNIYTVTGCVTTDTQLVRMFKEREIYVPTAFTPNNDGKNDRLYPILAGVNQLTYFRVYNRWGNLVFETRQAGAAYGWDGTFKGQLQPTETYVWVAEGIDIDGKPVKRNGTSLLIR